jgi:hypothetical protein
MAQQDAVVASSDDGTQPSNASAPVIESATARAVPGRIALTVIALVGYVVASRAVENLYPFSTFSMYAESSVVPSRVLARASDGSLHEVTEFTAWHCPTLPALDRAQCAESRDSGIPYVDREIESFIRAHRVATASPSSTSLDLVRHLWFFRSGDGPPTGVDCPIVRCEAQPR